MNRCLYRSLMVSFFLVNTLSWWPARGEPQDQVPESCAPQLPLLCPSESLVADKARCLVKNFKSLSEDCQQELKSFGRAAEQAENQAQGSLISPSTMSSMSPPFPVLTLEGRLAPGENKMTEARVMLSSPIHQTKEKTLSFSLSKGEIEFQDAISLDGKTIVPTTLHRAEVGLQYSRQLPSYQNVGIRASIGHAGDALLRNSDDTTFSLMANYGHPTKTGAFWVWSIFFANNTPLGNYIPIPGFMYMTRTPTFTGMYGFPLLSLQWTPSPDRSYSLSLLGLAVTTEAAVGTLSSGQFFTSLKWANQSFVLSKRTEDRERLTLEEKKFALGLRRFIWGRLQLEGEVGHAFDRLLFSGKGVRNMQGGSADLEANRYAAVLMKAGF